MACGNENINSIEAEDPADLPTETDFLRFHGQKTKKDSKMDLLKKLVERPILPPKHANDLFFASIAAVVKGFPAVYQTDARKRFSELLHHIEMEVLNEGEYLLHDI